MPDDAPPNINGSQKPDADDELDSLAARFHAGDSAGDSSGGSGADSSGSGGANVSGNRAARRSGSGSTSTAPEEEFSRDTLRSTALGRRLAQRRGYAIAGREPKPKRLLSSWGLGGVMLLSLWSLWGTGPDFRYWVQGAPPIDLGHMGGYHLENAREGAFTHVEGIASPKRASYSRMFGEHELIPLIGSRILVDRAQSPDESMRGFGFHYSGEGRLVRAAEGSKWDAVREQFSDAGELARQGDVWVLEDGLSPRRGLRIPLEVGLWLAAVLACATTLVLRARRNTLREPG